MTTATERTITSFTQSPDMWHGFAGCECWPNGAEPVFTEIGQWLIVADPNGTGIYGDVEADQFGGLAINTPHKTQQAARAFLTGLPDDFNPADFGAESF